MEKKRITREEIEAARTPTGGWTREQLREWGVAWPPPKGWKNALAAEPSDIAGHQREFRDRIVGRDGEVERAADLYDDAPLSEIERDLFVALRALVRRRGVREVARKLADAATMLVKDC